MQKKILLTLIFITTLFAVEKSLLANFEIPGFELVYTAPVEAGLDAKDLRNPVDVWPEMFDEAKREIVLGQMYAVGKTGEALEPVMDSLEKAGKRGVKIRMLLEQKMLRASDPGTIERLKKIPNLQLHIVAFAKVRPDAIIHAKYIVVDRKTAYVGSQNFDWRSLKHIHELGLKITQKEIVQNVQAIFDLDWMNTEKAEKKQKITPSQKKPLLVKGDKASYLVASPYAWNPKNVPDSESELMRLLAQAKEEVLVQTMDYSPLNYKKVFYPVIDNAIRAALARGVKVKLLVAHWSTGKPAIDHLKSLSLIPGIEIKIATIPAAKEGFIPFARVNHSKYMVMDKKLAWIGTSNWAGGYLDNSRNLEVVVRDEKLATRVAELFTQIWSAPFSEKIDVNKEYAKPVKGD